MKLQNFKRVYKTDYKAEFQELIEQLSITINNGFEALYNLTNNNISLKDNISCTLKSIQLTVDTNGTPLAQLILSLSKKTKVQGLTILKIDNLTNTTSYTTSGVNISFSIIDSGIRFDNVKGLIANNNYQINLVIFQD